ncbi:MAG: UDP-N-acetylmuramoyl-tripeptide--D-alanyl-D-alanine ligase [Saprospiraceae bacterium]|nr:UDP-N-acetylmuramoyl-tripeptide--D-alanyl-D-alanine ligase [Saprospiraceae bacterium]
MNTADLYAIFLRHPVVVTDSRRIVPGCLFFALRGDTFNGNHFAAAALEQGATYCIVDDATLRDKPGHIQVPDVLTTLQDLARQHRRQFDIPVIAITGSNGKTTTKELAASVLGSHFRIHFTQGNLNNHIGVPLTLLAMPQDTAIAVIEMGANHQGEIDALCRIAEPTYGLITNIGKAHLEGFGGIEGVKKGKSELYRYLAQCDGTAFVNSDEDFLEALAQPVARKVFYGRTQPAPSEAGDFIPIALTGEQPFVQVAFSDGERNMINIHSRLIGAYNFGNIASAIALGCHFQVPIARIQSAIEAYIPENMRSQLLTRGSNTYILDAYNANPSSVREAILNFARMPALHKVAILGDMLELGEYTADEHQKIATLAAAQGFNHVILTGPLFADAAQQVGLLHFPNVELLSEWLQTQAFEGVHFLIKGSRGMKMEQLLTEKN